MYIEVLLTNKCWNLFALWPWSKNLDLYKIPEFFARHFASLSRAISKFLVCGSYTLDTGLAPDSCDLQLWAADLGFVLDTPPQSWWTFVPNYFIILQRMGKIMTGQTRTHIHQTIRQKLQLSRANRKQARQKWTILDNCSICLCKLE
jgi:hypothetical protein